MADTEHKLGRLQQFDQRSRSFNIADVLPDKKPRSYTWAVPYLLNQGSIGSCVGFSWSHELIARPKMVQGITYDTALALYKRAQDLDEWDGNQYEGTSVLAGAKAVKESGKITEYRWAFNLNDAILSIGYTGCAVIGINWYEGMFQTNSEGFVRPTGNIAGGHAILVNRVSVKGQFVELVNSWGENFGIGGRCKLTFDDFGRLLSEQGECCLVSGRTL